MHYFIRRLTEKPADRPLLSFAIVVSPYLPSQFRQTRPDASCCRRNFYRGTLSQLRSSRLRFAITYAEEVRSQRGAGTRKRRSHQECKLALFPAVRTAGHPPWPPPAPPGTCTKTPDTAIRTPHFRETWTCKQKI